MTIKISDERKRHSKLVREKNAAKRMVIEKSEGDREKVRKILRKLRKVGKRKWGKWGKWGKWRKWRK